MTYNIRLDHAGDNENNWKHRKADLIKYIEKENPDFLGIQEGMHHQVQYLSENLQEYVYIGVARDDGGKRGEYCAIFYKKDEWRMEATHNFWLSETPYLPTLGWDAACFRVATYGIFKNKNDQQIAVLNTHFDHVGKTARAESVKLLNETVTYLQKTAPTVLMGDFNLTSETELYAGLNENLKDAFTLTENRKEDYRGTFNAFKMEGDFDRRIDYIFANPENLQVLNYRVDTPKTEEGRQLSDHFPVIINLNFKKK